MFVSFYTRVFFSVVEAHSHDCAAEYWGLYICLSSAFLSICDFVCNFPSERTWIAFYLGHTAFIYLLFRLLVFMETCDSYDHGSILML